MSKMTELCRSVKMFNDHEFFGDEPFIYYHADEGYRSTNHSSWRICHKTLGNKWHPYKEITVWSRDDKQNRFNEAVLFLYQQFGVEELARSPFGGWGDAEYVTRRIAEIKKLAQERQSQRT